MAFKTLQAGAIASFSMEDIFTQGAADKLTWVNEWRKLPHIKPEVSKQFEYPEGFAQMLHARVEQSLQQCVVNVESKGTIKHGSLFVQPKSVSQANAALAQIPELPVRHIISSDQQEVEALKAEFQDEGDLLHCRIEGEFLASYQTSQGWIGISKDILTEVLGVGKDVKITGLLDEVAQVLDLMCPELVVLTSNSDDSNSSG